MSQLNPGQELLDNLLLVCYSFFFFYSLLILHCNFIGFYLVQKFDPGSSDYIQLLKHKQNISAVSLMCNIKARGGCPHMGQCNVSTGTYGTYILLLLLWKMLADEAIQSFFCYKKAIILKNTGNISD